MTRRLLEKLLEKDSPSLFIAGGGLLVAAGWLAFGIATGLAIAGAMLILTDLARE